MRNDLVPIQWSLRKPSEIEIRYGISGKEMLVVIWGTKRFDYKLQGRRFHQIPDYGTTRDWRR
jgi:hypothetical protein